MLDVCLLGTGGMMPLPNRWLTSMMIRYNGSSMLIDCGEGTQITMRLQGWSFKAIDFICFTHYHGDHIGGLPGLLLTIGNSDRREPITLIGPKGLKRIVEGLMLIAPELPYELKFIELDFKNIEDNKFGDFNITTIPLNHGIPCIGYCINIKRLPRFMPEKAKQLNIPVTSWSKLQNGENIEVDGITILPESVLGEERKGIRVSYCTDTRPTDDIVKVVEGSDLFICEGMYGDKEKINKAKEYKHMTFYEAADIACKAKVNELWLTHYSPSLVNPADYKDDVRKIFKNTKLGKDRMTKTLFFEDE